MKCTNRVSSLACALALMLPLASSAADEQRVNLWPVFYYDPPDSMMCFPLFARDHDSFFSLPVCWGKNFATIPPTLSWYSHSENGLENYVALCGLFDVSFWGGAYAESWLMPLYYHDRDKFVSPVFGWGSDFETVPLALSWHARKGRRDSYRALFGLGGATFENGRYDQSWLLPLYYHDNSQFVSPLIGWGTGYAAIPALLSWRATKGERVSYRALLGLGGATFENGRYDHSWMLPLYYHEAGTFVSPLVGWGDRFVAIPAALSWREKAGERASYRLLLGLGSATWKGDQYERSWLLPLYYHHPNLFLSLLSLWGRDWGVCPAVLSWYWKNGPDESYLALLGLGGLLRESDSYDGSWLLPLYYHDANRLLTPLVGWGESFEVVPALLSWHYHSEDRDSYLALLGLGGFSYRKGTYDSSWLFPFFYHDTDGGFATLLYCRMKNGWGLPALLTFQSKGDDGKDLWTSLPLLSSVTMQAEDVRSVRAGLGLLFSVDYDEKECTHWSALGVLANYKKKDEREIWTSLLLGGYEREKGVYAESHVLPFYSHKASGEFISLLPYSTWTDGDNRRNDLYGYFALHTTGSDYSRFSILWKFFDRKEERGIVNIDAFPGITYDSQEDGTIDFSLWYRFFRYRATRDGLTDLSVFFIPFK